MREALVPSKTYSYFSASKKLSTSSFFKESRQEPTPCERFHQALFEENMRNMLARAYKIELPSGCTDLCQDNATHHTSQERNPYGAEEERDGTWRAV